MSDEERDVSVEQDGGLDDQSVTPPVESEPAGAHPQVGAIEALAVEESHGIGWTPFLAYLAVWVVLAVAAVFLLRPAALDGGARWVPEYLYAVYAGIGMTGLGPVLAIVVWLVVRARRTPEARRGLFVSALVKGAVVTFTGVVMWMVALYVLDLFTSGILV